MSVTVLGLIRCNCDRCDCAASASLSSHDCKPVQCFSVQCLGAVCVAGRAQPQHEPHDGAAALTVHQYASLTTHQPKVAFASVLQAASKGPTRNSERSIHQTSRDERGRSRDASVQLKPSCSALSSFAEPNWFAPQRLSSIAPPRAGDRCQVNEQPSKFGGAASGQGTQFGLGTQAVKRPKTAHPRPRLNGNGRQHLPRAADAQFAGR